MTWFAVVGRFLLRHLDKIIIVAIVVISLLAAYGFVYNRGKSASDLKWNAVVAKLESSYADERTKSALELADAERRYREEEAKGRRQKEEQDAKDAKRDADWEARMRASADNRKQLLDHITRLTRHAGTGQATTDSGSACRDLQNRLAATGPLLERIDSMAERCAGDYGKARLTVDSCVEYANQVRSK
jgi:FtsZ-interacting cell division protein ZipA